MATVQNMVRNTAEVIQVVELVPGDVYKRLETSSYAAPKLLVGIVTGVLNNGEASAITAVEYATGYSGAETTLKVFTDQDGSSLQLFPASQEEITEHFGKIEQAARDAVTSAEGKAEQARQVYGEVSKASQMAKQSGLTTPAVVKAVES